MRSEKARCRKVITCGLTVLVICVASAWPSSAETKAKPRPGYCASDADLAALNARVLQTELMVAALSCDEKQRYNSFVTAYRDVLKDRGQALQALFRRAHGAKANTRLNAFITKLANDASQEVRSKGNEYCVFAGELFNETITASPREFNRIANKDWIASRHGFQPCVQQASKQTG
jgi:hypothetical protein